MARWEAGNERRPLFWLKTYYHQRRESMPRGVKSG